MIQIGWTVVFAVCHIVSVQLGYLTWYAPS